MGSRFAFVGRSCELQRIFALATIAAEVDPDVDLAMRSHFEREMRLYEAWGERLFADLGWSLRDGVSTHHFAAVMRCCVNGFRTVAGHSPLQMYVLVWEPSSCTKYGDKSSSHFETLIFALAHILSAPLSDSWLMADEPLPTL